MLLKIVLFILCFCPTITFAQIKIKVVNNRLGSVIDSVRIFDAQGRQLGRTNSLGNADIVINSFPVFLEKQGYVTLSVYDIQNLQPARMIPFGKTLKTVHITGKLDVKKYLLHLRDVNYPDFVHNDTTLYYKFNYSLSFPDKKWKEQASGYIKVNRARFIDYLVKNDINDPSVSNTVLGVLAAFTDFHYHNSSNAFVQSRDFKKARPASIFYMFMDDFMSPVGYRIWSKLTHKYRFWNKISPLSDGKIYGNRDWHFHSNPNKQKVFDAIDEDNQQKLMEEIVFDSLGKLQTVTLFKPPNVSGFGTFKFLNNFDSENNINSYHSVYTYSTKNKQRTLSEINHLSTFYKKGETYYKMSFAATLCNMAPKEKYNIDVINMMMGTAEHPYQHGYSVWQLTQQKVKK